MDGDLLWIIDFDNCEHGHFVQDFATILYDSIYCRVLNKFADAGSTTASPRYRLREAVIYIHYYRTLDVPALDDSFKAGLEVMRTNIENQEHQVDVARLERLCEES